MKILVIGGNRFVGLRLCLDLDQQAQHELHILNRTGQVAHLKNGYVYKGSRQNLAGAGIDREWDVVVDFANFNENDAREAIKHFTKVGRYIVISTASVYDLGASLKEFKFDPNQFDLSKPAANHANPALNYQDGKRRMEAVFAQSHFPVVMVRFPFILGPDDYTERLAFHVNRVENGQPIYFPNLQARVSMIHSEDACRFLLWALNENFTGPLNVASPQPISFHEMMGVIQSHVMKKPIYTSTPSHEDHSPYGVPEDYFLNVDRLTQLGFQAQPITQWLGRLVDDLRVSGVPSVH